ncbi:hypothetical protein GLOIN_2v1882676 [Rhizophagus clarus]|uniref:TLDc domain-containing protein n=1 Tax=Rhizophagus clarus TaxID=94130 RepID=A0A8H3QMH0_9GLOM|nr:hypothetical protein GLOIN_2v1882676 [Rhizophagus clarus]
MLKVLDTADQLHLQELVDYLQKYLIENKVEWMEQNFGLVCQTSFKSNSLLELQQFCLDSMTKSPQKIFRSLDFTSFSEKPLVLLIKRDDLQMKEVEIWEHVLKWGLAQNPTLFLDPVTWTDEDFKMMKNTLRSCLPLVRFFSLSSVEFAQKHNGLVHIKLQNISPEIFQIILEYIYGDPNAWSDDDFKTMENTLQHCLLLVRFFSLSSEEFSQKVHPYKKLLKHQFYEELLNSYLDPNREPIDNILLPRNMTVDNIIDSRIVNLNIVSIISRWIDRTELNYKFSHLRELYFPYQFKLLLRGSRDGFTPKKFHELCGGIHNTVTFIKLKDSEEIIGGYSPIKWETPRNWGATKDSFIFSFKNKDNFKDTVISNVKDLDYAIWFHSLSGPYFGKDINIHASNEFTDYDTICCKKFHYDKKIRDSGEKFYRRL